MASVQSMRGRTPVDPLRTRSGGGDARGDKAYSSYDNRAYSASAGNWQNVRLENLRGFRCLGVGSASGDGTPALQWTCNDATDERWTIAENSAGYHTIKNKFSGKCLGVGSSEANSAHVIQWSCNGS
ncbi:RICIN domain-containing protein [Streptomyces noursei]|uniref:RICIN domain-containing protein n=1 Tax=Streptomyces noursei TaxID=1971 RepID=UPI000996D72D